MSDDMGRDTADLDEKDIQILKAVAAKGVTSPDKIHQETGIPKSTVHYRLDQLQDAGVLENDRYDMNLEKLGLSITLISEVWAEFDEGYHQTVGEKLTAIEGVNQVHFTMGETDFVVIAHVPNRQMVESLVADYESIDEIRRTSSKFVITTLKDEPLPVNDFEYETLVHALTDAEVAVEGQDVDED
ncbi:AsnC family transcriptional regulator [Natrialba hulunbeirensis JCM 10989]|uniref:AsnC family transcriptional regulator n=1 Tax=Natrialba hulunbeirensis JCM 10989 TaxID=1227493 RepID=M0A4V9_9EURY|nr:Lrp/AsnC family transcriptional regulator [Natrialba hulunbeirensis]ELY92942.1 AsnC family transcriptional regulator [Natrialba hulunbeirensis JCM 10989]